MPKKNKLKMTWSPFSNLQVPQWVIFSDLKFGSNFEGENLRLLRKRGVKVREQGSI